MLEYNGTVQVYHTVSSTLEICMNSCHPEVGGLSDVFCAVEYLTLSVGNSAVHASMLCELLEDQEIQENHVF